MFGRGAAAAADDADAERGGFAREQSKIFGRRTRVDRTVTDALGETRIGHGRQRNDGNRGKVAQHGKQQLRADGAVGSDGLNVVGGEYLPGILRTSAPKGR